MPERGINAPATAAETDQQQRDGPQQEVTITATAHWVIVWNGLGQQGTIEMDLSSQVHTSVIEAFAVNIPNGRRHSVPSPSPSPNPTGTPTALAPCPTNHNKHGC